MPPSIQSLQQWCAERLSKAKRPADITLLDELPRTSVGKIRKFILTEAAARPSRDRQPTQLGAPR